MSNLRFVWPPTCLNLDRLAWVCIDFRLAQISTQVDAGFSSFVYPTQVDTKPFAYAWNLRLLATCMKLRADLRIRLATLASPYTSSWANFCRAWETCQENLVWLQRRRKHKQARLELETPEQSELRRQVQRRQRREQKTRKTVSQKRLQSRRVREQRRARLARETPVHLYGLLCFRGWESLSKKKKLM